MKRSLILVTALGFSACQVPSVIQPSPLTLQGTYNFPAPPLRTQTIAPEQTTITLSHPPGHAQAKQPIVSTLAGANGLFNFPWPNAQIPAAGDIFLLQAAKRAGRTSKDLLTLSTYIRRTDSGWESITGSSLRLDALTTALVTLDTHREDITAADLITTVTTLGEAPTLPNIPHETVTQVYGLTRWLLEQQHDPQHFIGYTSGVFHPIRPPSLTLEALRATGKCPNCDFSELDLSGEDLSNKDLRGADFSHSNLTAVSFQNSQIDNIKLDHTKLTDILWPMDEVIVPFCPDNQATCYQEFNPSNNTSRNWVPDVAQSPNGLHWVVWAQNSRAWGRAYAPDGSPLTAPFMLGENTPAQGEHVPRVAYSSIGRVLTGWEDYGGISRFKGRVFTPDGTPVTPTITLSDSAFYKDDLRLAGSANGRFIAVWASTNQDGSEQGVFMRRFGPDGTPLHAQEQRVNVQTLQSQHNPSVGMSPDGRFVVSWYSSYQNIPRIVARTFAADGTPTSDEITIATQAGSQASVDCDDAGNFVVAWAATNSLKLRRYSATGVPLSEEHTLSPATWGVSEALDLDMDRQGRVVVAWNTSNNTVGDGYDVSVQRFAADLTPVGTSERTSMLTRQELYLSTSLSDSGKILTAYQTYLTGPVDLAVGVKPMRF
jgi:hypothetical protein